jgi:hypothetical protein
MAIPLGSATAELDGKFLMAAFECGVLAPPPARRKRDPERGPGPDDRNPLPEERARNAGLLARAFLARVAVAT